MNSGSIPCGSNKSRLALGPTWTPLQREPGLFHGLQLQGHESAVELCLVPILISGALPPVHTSVWYSASAAEHVRRHACFLLSKVAVTYGFITALLLFAVLVIKDKQINYQINLLNDLKHVL
jgi:hypothetical protein